MLSLSEKVEVLNKDLVRKEKKLYAELLKICGQHESSLHKIVKKGKEIRVSFTVAPQTKSVTATTLKCLVKMEKCSICPVRYFERDYIHVTSITVYCYNCSTLVFIMLISYWACFIN